MKKVCSTKIGKKRSKPGIEYPLLRLPKDYLYLVGEYVKVFETEYEDSPAFLILRDNKVEQLKFNSDLETRVSKLEAELDNLKNLLKNRDGLEEIRTPDLRRVKATS